MAKGGISIDIKILDTKEFKTLLSCVKEIIEDERMPEDIRQEYMQKIVTAIKPDYVIHDDAGIRYFGMEDKSND